MSYLYSNREYYEMVRVYLLSGENLAGAQRMYKAMSLKRLQKQGYVNAPVPNTSTILDVNQRLIEFGQFTTPNHASGRGGRKIPIGLKDKILQFFEKHPNASTLEVARQFNVSQFVAWKLKNGPLEVHTIDDNEEPTEICNIEEDSSKSEKITVVPRKRLKKSHIDILEEVSTKTTTVPEEDSASVNTKISLKENNSILKPVTCEKITAVPRKRLKNSHIEIPEEVSTKTAIVLEEDSTSVNSRISLEENNSKPVQAEDEYKIFGEYVANELRNMHCQKNKRELKRLIQRHIITLTEKDDQDFYEENNVDISRSRDDPLESIAVKVE